MIYVADFTTPANTPRTSPVETLLRVTRGLVYRFELQFPAGALGLHHVWVQDGGAQIWPSSPHETFHPDRATISFDETYLKTAPPYEFIILSYNLDDTYAHAAQCRIGMVGQERLWGRFLGQPAPSSESLPDGGLHTALAEEANDARRSASILSRALLNME